MAEMNEKLNEYQEGLDDPLKEHISKIRIDKKDK